MCEGTLLPPSTFHLARFEVGCAFSALPMVFAPAFFLFPLVTTIPLVVLAAALGPLAAAVPAFPDVWM